MSSSAFSSFLVEGDPDEIAKLFDLVKDEINTKGISAQVTPIEDEDSEDEEDTDE